MEPWESVQIETSNDYASTIIERMATREAKLGDMTTSGDQQTLKFEISTAALLGMRSWIREATGGTAIVVSEFLEMRPAGLPLPKIRNGALVSNTAGVATAVDLSKAQ